MEQIKPKTQAELRSMLLRAECSTDPHDQNAAHWLREALRPRKPRDLLREHILGLFGEQSFALLTNDEVGAKQIELEVSKALLSTFAEKSASNN